MVNKTLKKADRLWQDYTGAKWKNLSYANTGDNHAGYCYPLGKNNKTSYRPKSLFYYYQVKNIDSNIYWIDSVKFILVIGKFNTKQNNLPTVKVFSGDSKTPYETDPIKTVKTYKKLAKEYDGDSYVLEYDITGLTINQLKNTIIEVDWTKTKITGKSTISVNRARLEVNYSLKRPKWNLYGSISNENIVNGTDVGWTVIAKNTGIKGTDQVNITLPPGCMLIDTTGDGAYDTESGNWTFEGTGTVKRHFLLRFYQLGFKDIVAKSSEDTLNLEVFVTSNTNKPQQIQGDGIVYDFYDAYANEERQYFDLKIYGIGRYHNNGKACYTITTSSNVTLNTPLHNENVYNYSADTNVISVDNTTTDNILCLNVEPGENFEAHLRLHMDCARYSEGSVGSITVTDSQGHSTTGYFDILPPIPYTPNIIPSISHDLQYVQQSVNIGLPDIWTIRLESSKTNFFEEKQSDLEISIEKQIAYIGCVPLQRPHKDDLKANTSNTLIDDGYLNRRHLGKKGDYKEDIPMTLRMPWPDVATIQGLAAMDKPVPIDTCPELLDGDPINHRGWAELYGVKNIRKINNMLYECEPEVAYLTHELLTEFSVEKKDKLTDAEIEYYLQETHEYGDNLLDRFQCNYNQLFWNEENTTGDLVGCYEIPTMSNLKLNSIEKLNSYSNYNIIFSNTLPMMKSEDYDSNWEMSIRLLDKETGNTLFEHLYNNFKHYDFNSDEVINQCDITTKILRSNKNYEILHHDTHKLLYDGNNEDAGKIPTYFNNIGDLSFNDIETDKVEIFLLDKYNTQLADKKIKITISSEDSTYNEVFYDITNMFGRIQFPILLNNGDYLLTFKFEGDTEYKSCTYKANMTVDYDEVQYHWEYEGVSTVNSIDDVYIATLYDSNDEPVEGYTVHYAFKDIGAEEYSYEETLVTNQDGEIEIPLNYVNGSKILKVSFKGFTDEHNIHQPCSFEDMINIAIIGEDTLIEADDISFMQGESEHIYYIILKDGKGQALANKEVTFGFNNIESNFSFTRTTNEYGVASIPLYLNRGVWNTSIIFKGDETYKPCFASKTITVMNHKQYRTLMNGENTVLNEDNILNETQGLYKVTLYDRDNNIPISDKPVQIKVYNFNESILYVDTIRFTNIDGSIEVPFISHNENVIVKTRFQGDSWYEECELINTVYFEEVTGKEELDVNVELHRAGQGKNPGYNMPYVTIQYNGVDVNLDYEIITTKTGDNNNSHEGTENFCLLQLDEFKFTVLVYGNNLYYSQTISVTKTIDGSYTGAPPTHKLDLVSVMINDIEYQPGDNISAQMGDKFKLRFSTDYIYEYYMIFYGRTQQGLYISDPYNIATHDTKYNSFNDEYDIELEGVIEDRLILNQCMIQLQDSLFESSEYDLHIANIITINEGDNENSDLILKNRGVNETATILNIYSYNNESVILYLLNRSTHDKLMYYTFLSDNQNVLDVYMTPGTWEGYLITNAKKGCKNNILHKSFSINHTTIIEPSEESVGDISLSEVMVMQDTDGQTFGSNVYMKLRGNKIEFSDYGMVKDSDDASGDIILGEEELLDGDYELELEINYKNNNMNRLNDLTGNIQMNIYEDTVNSDGANDYNDLIVSPMPLQEGKTRFTRHTDEGTMYYVKVKESDNKTYICNPYIQYKGGVELTSVNGIGLFDLENAYSPVIMNNGLVSAEFHRYSGYIRLGRYDERSRQWYYCNTFKLTKSNPKLELVSNYTDDRVELKFGNTVWKMWRGRPFILCNHEKEDLRIMKLVDHVYCETIPNQQSIGFLESDDDLYSIFCTHTSIQKFPKEYHVGETIREDNFRLYSLLQNNRIRDLDNDVTLEVSEWNRIKSVHVVKDENCRVGVNFSANPNLVKKPADCISLLIANIKALGSDGTVQIKCRGFDDRGMVPCNEQIQYGIWEETITTSIDCDNTHDSIRVTFDEIPREVEYVDFLLILPDTLFEVWFNQIMLYEGDSIIGYDKDISKTNARNVPVNFNETYYACLYNEDDNYGLAVYRMGKESFTLNKLTSAKETVLVPYMKVARDCDNISNVFMEYLNSKDQTINIRKED